MGLVALERHLVAATIDPPEQPLLSEIVLGVAEAIAAGSPPAIVGRDVLPGPLEMAGEDFTRADLLDTILIWK